MPCSDYSNYYEFLVEGQIFDAIYCPFGDVLGGALFALIFFGGIILATYVYSDSVALPLSLTVILGSVVVVQLPSAAVQLIAATLLLGLTASGYILIQRSSPR